jgi:hypothetical protein
LVATSWQQLVTRRDSRYWSGQLFSDRSDAETTQRDARSNLRDRLVLLIGYRSGSWLVDGIQPPG